MRIGLVGGQSLVTLALRQTSRRDSNMDAITAQATGGRVLLRKINRVRSEWKTGSGTARRSKLSQALDRKPARKEEQRKFKRMCCPSIWTG